MSSTDLKILIMAQGNATRFPGKHFAKVAGVPIVERTLKLLMGKPVTVVARKLPQWEAICAKYGADLYTLPDPGDALMDGLWHSMPQWYLRDSIILLGDVVFSHAALLMLLHSRRKLAFLGRSGQNQFTGCPHGEIFGLSVSAEASDGLLDVLSQTQHRAERDGRFWGLWDLTQRDIGSAAWARASASTTWLEVGDWTDDVDTPEELAAVNAISDLILEDV